MPKTTILTCPECNSTMLGAVDATGEAECLNCGKTSCVRPGLNIRFLAQGMIKISFQDLPEEFFSWDKEDQIKWAYEYWSDLTDDDLVRGIAYLTPSEDSVPDCLEVEDSWAYPVIARTKAWEAYYDLGLAWGDLVPVEGVQNG